MAYLAERSNQASTLYAQASKWGVYLGAGLVALITMIYLVNVDLLGSYWFFILTLLVWFSVVIYSGIKFRSVHGGLLTFGNAFAYSFLLLAVSGFLTTIFNIVLHQVDDTLGQRLTSAFVRNTEGLMTWLGAPLATVNETTNDMRNDLPSQFTVGGLIVGYIKGLFTFAIVALIASLGLRKGGNA